MLMTYLEKPGPACASMKQGGNQNFAENQLKLLNLS